MRHFKFLLYSLFLTLSFCKEAPSLSTIDQDLIYKDLKKELLALESDRKVLVEKNVVVDSKISDKSSNQKFNELLRKQKYSNNRFMESIDQYTNFIKIKSLDREKLYLDKLGSQPEQIMAKEYEEYLINKKVNSPSYPWRKATSVLPGDKNKKAPENKKEPEHGAPSGGEKSAHGNPHGAAAPEPNKPSQGGGGHH